MLDTYKNSLMSGFEPWISGVRSYHSTKRGTTTAHLHHNLRLQTFYKIVRRKCTEVNHPINVICVYVSS